MKWPNKVFLNTEGIIEIQVIGDQTGESVAAMGDDIAALIDQQRAAGKPVLLLDDLRQMGGASPDARRAVVELAKNLTYHKAVMVGTGSFLRLGANLMLRATGKSAKLRYFENYDEAVAWLEA